MTSSVLGRVLRLRPKQLDPARKTFIPAEPHVQSRLDAVIDSFVSGYNYAITSQRPYRDLAEVPAQLRGFAVEGAAMSSALADLITFSGGRRVRALSAAHGDQYTHLIHVGVGWAFARLRRQPYQGLRFGEPVIRWLAWDGWGFHQTFFGAQQVLEGQFIERAARGLTRPLRDQGVGRALWFYAGADPVRIAAVIGDFPEWRRPDLWAGVGLAASYTGAQSAPVVEKLAGAADGYRDHLAQGAAFAAKAHVLSGPVPGPSAETIEILTGAAPAVAARWTDTALRAVAAGGSGDVAAYQRWRGGIRHEYERSRGGDIF